MKNKVQFGILCVLLALFFSVLMFQRNISSYFFDKNIVSQTLNNASVNQKFDNSDLQEKKKRDIPEHVVSTNSTREELIGFAESQGILDEEEKGMLFNIDLKPVPYLDNLYLLSMSLNRPNTKRIYPFIKNTDSFTLIKSTVFYTDVGAQTEVTFDIKKRIFSEITSLHSDVNPNITVCTIKSYYFDFGNNEGRFYPLPENSFTLNDVNQTCSDVSKRKLKTVDEVTRADIVDYLNNILDPSDFLIRDYARSNDSPSDTDLLSLKKITPYITEVHIAGNLGYFSGLFFIDTTDHLKGSKLYDSGGEFGFSESFGFEKEKDFYYKVTSSVENDLLKCSYEKYTFNSLKRDFVIFDSKLFTKKYENEKSRCNFGEYGINTSFEDGKVY